MQVYTIIETGGEYEDSWWKIHSIYTRKELALEILKGLQYANNPDNIPVDSDTFYTLLNEIDEALDIEGENNKFYYSSNKQIQPFLKCKNISSADWDQSCDFYFEYYFDKCYFRLEEHELIS